MWILGCKVTLPQLSHMHQAKSKSEGLPEIPLGILTYPVLQTADILLFKGTHIPVGEDQLQHLELSRGIAAKFNNFYKTSFFPMPKAIESKKKNFISLENRSIWVLLNFSLLLGEYTKLKSLRDPTKKMSKSDPDQNGRIDLTDPVDMIAKKIRKAVTDSTSAVIYDPEARPGVGTLIEIEAACTGQDVEEIVEACYLSAMETGEYKKRVAQVLSDHLKPIQREYERLIKDRGHLSQILKRGADRANEIAAVNYSEVVKIIGAN
jgi:tryptophanyl-tRNA synthetase